jgi:hypothetical protein
MFVQEKQLSKEQGDIVAIMEAYIDSVLRSIHTMLPGEVQSYDESKRKVSVKPQIKLRTKKETLLTIPPIDNVPVHFMGSENFVLKFPLKKGSKGIILFAEEGIGAWLKGRTDVAADNLAKFNLTDAVFIPGLFPFVNIPNEQSSIVVANDGTLELNGNTKSFVTHAELKSALNIFVGALNTALAAKLDGGGSNPGLTINIDNAETQKVKTS